MKLFYTIVLILLPFSVCGQIITTFAGGGTAGDGSPATTARIVDPNGCVFDKYGNFYIASAFGGNRIRKINISGVISTYAGIGISGYSGDGGQATDAKLNLPVDIISDTNGDIYFSDAGNNRIRKISAATGVITTLVGSGSATYSGDGGMATYATINDPQGICVDKFGNLYISDAENNRVRKVNTTGIITTFAGTGTYGFSGDGGLATAAEIWLPCSVTSDDTGNIYISDRGNFRIRKVDTFGIITTFAGNGSSTYIGDGISATNAQFCPNWIRMDVNNNLYIGDQNINYRVYKIDGTGIFHSIAGNGMTTGSLGDGGPATDAVIFYASGLAFDNCDNLYIGDVNHNRVRKITYSGTGVPIVVTVSAPAAAKIDSTVTLTANITGGCCGVADTIIWYNKGVVFATTTTNTVTYTKTMNTDSITAKAKGCGDSSVSGVYVITKNTTSTPGPFSTSGEGVTCYPNPVHSELVIHAGFEIENVVITNMVGQVVYQLSAVSSQLSVCDVRGLVSGVYFVKVNGVYIEKFVKE